MRKGFAISGVDQRAAAGANDMPLACRQLRTERRLGRAKDRLAIFAKDLANWFAKVGDQLVIHVDKGSVETLGQPAAHTCLAGGHKAGEDNILFGCN